MTNDPNQDRYQTLPGARPPMHPCLIVLLVVTAVVVVGFLLLFGFCYFMLNGTLKNNGF